MFFRAAAATAVLATAALAQASNPTTEIADSLLQYQAQGLIPEPIARDDYNLSSAVHLSFGGKNTTTGQRFTLPADEATLKTYPTWGLDVPASQQTTYGSKNFTALLVDPGAAGQTLGGSLVTRHYLANHLKYRNGVLSNSSGGLDIQTYNAPGPAAGSGTHRYLALVFDEGSNFKAPEGLNAAGTQLSNMTLSEYIDNSKIGKIVAMSFLLVENTSSGEQTFSSTSAVPSASVAAAASSIASSLGVTSSASGAAASGSSGSKSSGAASAYSFSAAAGAAVVGSLMLGAALL
ncbi:unnamed protein product [Parajaminaea phylloscopi]